MSFEAIIGHEMIIKQIQDSINSGRFSHAHLIVGEDGIGKSIIAKEIALKLLNKKENKNYVDIIEVRSGKNKNSIGVDEIREIIKEANKKPYESDKKIIIIYEAHKMTTEAQNAFLKTIEEPPNGVNLILLCETIELILETIRSRCQIYKLNRLNSKEMKIYIEKKYPGLEETDIRQLIAFSEGIPGRCKSFIEDDTFKEIRNKTINILLEVCKKDRYIIKQYENFFSKYKDQWREILSCFISYLRDIVVYKELGNKKIVINGDKLEEIKKLSNIYSFKELNEFIHIINKVRNNLERRINQELAFDIMLLNMQEV